MVARANARLGNCLSCGLEVQPGAGYAFLDPGRGWSVSCADPGCRATCGTAPEPEQRSPDDPSTSSLSAVRDRVLAGQSIHVWDLAAVAHSKGDGTIALEVCRQLVALQPYYGLAVKR